VVRAGGLSLPKLSAGIMVRVILGLTLTSIPLLYSTLPELLVGLSSIYTL